MKKRELWKKATDGKKVNYGKRNYGKRQLMEIIIYGNKWKTVNYGN